MIEKCFEKVVERKIEIYSPALDSYDPIWISINLFYFMATTQSGTSWLPEGYEIPTTSGNYTKLEVWETRIRVLSKPVIGYMYYQQGDDGKRKAIHSRIPFPKWTVINPAISKFTGKAEAPQEFWAFAVWNYGLKRVEVFELTKKVIKEAILSIHMDPDYGSPETLDIKITKTGEGKDTKYSILPSPPKPANQEILEEYEKAKINLDWLFTGDNIFWSDEVGEVDNSAEVEASVNSAFWPPAPTDSDMPH